MVRLRELTLKNHTMTIQNNRLFTPTAFVLLGLCFDSLFLGFDLKSQKTKPITRNNPLATEDQILKANLTQSCFADAKVS